MQQGATKLKVAEQLMLLPTTASVASRPVSFDRIYTLESTHDALLYGCELARLVPKQIYGHMDCDKTVWSRITSGELDLDGRDIRKFNTVVNNDAYLLYLNHIHGYDLHALRKTLDDKDRRISDIEAQLAAERLKNQTILDYERQKEGRK
jgi:hypothetical protein